MNARPDHPRGFTLIEMMITLGVFLLLAGAIFSIFGATLQSASTLEDNQNREDETQALGSWLRQSLLALPAEGNLVSYHRDGRPFDVSGIIWGAGDDLRALDLQPQANGNYTLRLASYRPGDAGSLSGLPPGPAGYTAALAAFQTQVFQDDPGLSWRPLIRDLKSVDWRFRTANVTVWQDTSVGGKPVLAEMTLQAAGATGPIVDDFWIPPVQSAGLPTSAPAPASITSAP
jgi:prepilin-type N-terminal cleavage/methylation domain-containing protein